MTNNKCSGRCENHGGHKGEVKRVRVTSVLKNWGKWWYCETAIKTDRENDFIVEEIGQ